MKRTKDLGDIFNTCLLPEDKSILLDSIFDEKTISVLYDRKRSKKDWKSYGFDLYESNPDKIIVTHSNFKGYILKMISPNYIFEGDATSELLIQLNLSRVYIAEQIRKVSSPFITTPKKYVYYLQPLKQWIVVAELIECTYSTEEALQQLTEEQVLELFRVCELVGFYDIAPRNLKILNDKICIIDTEDFMTFEDEMEELSPCEKRVNGMIGIKKKMDMYTSFKVFCESLNRELCQKLSNMLTRKLEFLQIYEYFKRNSCKDKK